MSTICSKCNSLLTKATFRAAYDLTSSGAIKAIEFVHADCNKGRYPLKAFWSDLTTLYLKPASLAIKARIFNAIQAFDGSVAA